MRMSATLLAKTLVRADHVRSFHIRPVPGAGWEAAEREDQRVLEQRSYTDWHRVEQTLARFRREIAHLREQGWHDA
jgi:hypothetical protein